jgi:uncharacterized integral membrane protein (TIGR00697 family)
MNHLTLSGRSLTLLLVLCALLVAFFVTGDLIGAKLFEFSILGLLPGHLGLAEGDARFVATIGILYFPLTFILTDIINEYFGKKVVRSLTFIAIGTLLLLQPVILWSIAAKTVSFNPAVSADDMHRSFAIVLGPAWAIVAGSCAAFAVGQWLDVKVFSAIRRITGGRMIWLRAQGSTLVSQLIDSFVVIFLAFVIIPHLFDTGSAPWAVGAAFMVALTNYVIKAFIAVGITPSLYVIHFLVELWLGRTESERLKGLAHPTDRT